MNTAQRIAVVGIACRYPDADSPEQLWENVLAGRRAFRRLPDERMRLDDYYSPDPAAPDRFYTRKAAVIEGFEFDRVRHKVAGSTFRSTDMTHWLALDTATRALEDAGLLDDGSLPRTRTGVIIGNTLTGEFTRANVMRLRWPYVRRTVGAALRDQGWDDEALAEFLAGLETRYKAPFPPVDEDTLAGGLANTIAGRICNHFDLSGGGYTVDGACSSSLLSVATAATALSDGTLDVAIAGGVDLSIDPFEVIGFAKTGALATGEMKVYDRGSNGFWPGEGCGMLVLMRDEDAIAQGRFRHAVLAGWGWSSDGKGGITRPEAAGHRLAMKRAYAMAGFGIDTVGYFEGHGTGTAVGDATELRAFSEEIREARGLASGGGSAASAVSGSPAGAAGAASGGPAGAAGSAGADAGAASGGAAGSAAAFGGAALTAPAAISTVKANFGHTKAAAGVAGLLKAVLAVRHRIIPPGTGNQDPHPELAAEDAVLRVPVRAELWPEGVPVRAAVSSMGFGGINAHLVVESGDGAHRQRVDREQRRLVRSRQDAELLLLDGDSLADLRGRIEPLAAFAGRLSYAELGDLAATLHGELAGRTYRAAVVAASPEEAETRLGKLVSLIDAGARAVQDAGGGVFLGRTGIAPRIGFLFPGQGAGRRGDGGALRRRFAEVEDLYAARDLPATADLVATQVAQPRIVTASLAGLRVLRALGITAVGAAGHSLGELTALHWAGAVGEDTLLRLVAERGRLMAELSASGTMTGLAAPAAEVEPLLAGEPVVIAGYNSRRQTVVSGPRDAVARVGQRAAEQGINVLPIAVSHAFHSAAVAPAAEAYREYLSAETFAPLAERVFSTVTADVLPAETAVPDLLRRQILEPVRFADAVQQLAADLDLLVEVGPGRVLAGLAADIAPTVPTVSLEADGTSLAGLLRVAGAAYCLGAPVETGYLFADRFTRPLALDKELRFFANPCETAPEGDFGLVAGTASAAAGTGTGIGIGDAAQTPAPAPVPLPAPSPASAAPAADSLSVLLRLAAERAELPLQAVDPHSNPLDELHLSSITVGQIMAQAARELGITAPVTTSAFATSTLAQLAELLDELSATAGTADPAPAVAAGVAPWVRAFTIDQVPAEAPPITAPALIGAAAGTWRVFAPAGHPLADPLRDALATAGLGDGVLLCLPTEADTAHVPLMLDAARTALADPAHPRFVTVGGKRGAAGLAKTLHLESPEIATTVVVLPPESPGAAGGPADAADLADLAARITADTAATTAFSEVHYDPDGTRTVPVLRTLSPAPGPSPLDAADVLLVTGGGKGITAEAALALARATGAAVALLGRSDPASDAELAANLDRFSSAGVKHVYVAADVADPARLAAAVDEIGAALGPVTALLHGAGRNVPGGLATLSADAFGATLAPKVAGLENVLGALDPGRLKLLISFGSIIGRAGLRGQADYAVANDWLTGLTERVAADHPGCRCVALEWSVWSGVGMGERLGVLESLIRDGIEPISVEAGIDILHRVLADPAAPTTLVVMGRASGLPTLALERAELPLSRFTERPVVHYPGIELVAEADLSREADLYLADHELDGDLLFPAVFGMEAMAQAGAALTGFQEAPVFEDVEFLRPVVVAPGGTTVRVAVLRQEGGAEDGTVRAVIRTADTGFQTDHFRATLRYGRPELAPVAVPVAADAPHVPLTPEDLYGPVLFQGRRFQRLVRYRGLAAKEVTADLANRSAAPWFAGFLPSGLSLADPGTRDTAMHAIQCAVPDATLLPAAVERLIPADPAVAAGEGMETVLLHAVERLRDGDVYVYDVDVLGEDGTVLERWEGLRLHAVRKQDGSGPWEAALLGPYIERRASVRTVVVPGAPEGIAERRAATADALGQALGRNVRPEYRADGKPEVEGWHVGAAHGAGVTVAVADATGPVACDVEAVVDRDRRDWEGLLGGAHLALADLLARDLGEPPATAATRVWTAVECLRKHGHAQASLTVERSPLPGWALLRAGDIRISTFATTVAGPDRPAVFAVSTAER